MIITLNADQQKAVNCKDKKILCLAGAGTGKTFTMIQRISSMVESGVSPSSILVLTFTNAAALEMKSRYKEDHKMQKCPEFRTFHAFCYAVLTSDKAVREELKYSKIPYIALDAVIKKLSKEALMQSGVNLSEKKISGKETLTVKEQKDLEIYNKTLDRLLKKKNLITFDKLCYDVCKLFVDDKECIRKYKDRYKHIFVDEFQDTDQKQYDFICSFKDADLFVVGDALQALYSFRGADSSIIKSLATDKDWTTIKLHENYRSSWDICEYANHMSTYADDSFRIAIHSNRFDKKVVVKKTNSSKYYINDKDCLALCADSVNWDGTTAILCRTNSEVKSVQKYFKDNGLSFSMGNKADVGVNVIRSIKDESFMVEWLASLLYADQYSIYIRESFGDNEYSLDKFLSRFKKNNDIIGEYSSLVNAVKNVLNTDTELLYKWIDIFNILSIKCQQMPEDIENNDQLLDEIEYSLSGGVTDESSVYIGTIHSSKGLEYDHVILLNVNGGSFPLTSEDNLNVFYVGITRAKSDLWVFRADID